ncbi:arylamine N-acetyltransferase family protein [Roseibium sp.]|uniref:arylamine N-acetyltransferase family protein n=1 Tax=Roseibium sp. TaxID=1936156 RepID=UPI003A96BEB8
MTFDLHTYLRRIGLNGCEPTLDGLRALQSHHMAAIPFENVLPFLGQIPDVRSEAVWKKIVENRLGGYCFEQNTLFGEALAAIGFSALPVLARVRKGPPEGRNRSHLAFVVTIEGKEWLTDCGFGGPAPAEPISLDTPEPQTIRGQGFRIRFDEAAQEQVLERDMADGWFELYSFDRMLPTFPDIVAANYICATWNQKPFVENLIFFRLTDGGRFSFLNGTARRKDDGTGETWQIETPEAFRRYVTDDLGLGYDEATIDALWYRMNELHPPIGVED